MIARYCLATLAFSLILSLTACGGGGGDTSSGGTGSTLPVAASTPHLATNATAQLLETEGVYYFGGANITINGVKQTHIRALRNGSTDHYFLNNAETPGAVIATTLKASHYAGVESSLVSNDLFDALPGLTLLSALGHYSSPFERVVYGATDTTVTGHPWQLQVTTADIAGTSIDTFLKQSRSGGSAPSASGIFSAGARSVALRYTATGDMLVWPASYTSPIHNSTTFQYIADLTELPSSVCFSKKSATTSLRVTFRADNVVEFRTFASSGTCSGSIPATATAPWTVKTINSQEYVDFAFPAGITLSDYDGTFSAAQFASGIRFAMAKPKTSLQWVMAYFVSPGVVVDDPVLHMNKQAADDLKAALLLP